MSSMMPCVSPSASFVERLAEHAARFCGIAFLLRELRQVRRRKRLAPRVGDLAAEYPVAFAQSFRSVDVPEPEQRRTQRAGGHRLVQTQAVLLREFERALESRLGVRKQAEGV